MDGLSAEPNLSLRLSPIQRAVLDCAPDAMVIVGIDGRVVYANAQTRSLFGYDAEELLQQPIELLVPEGHRERHVDHRKAYLAIPRTREMGAGLELVGRRKDGSEVPVEISLSPFTSEEGAFVVSAIRDVSERRQAKEALRRLNEELEERVRSRTAELVAALQEKEILLKEVHHRVKNNLQIISSLLNLQARRVPDGPAVEVLRESQARIQTIALFHEKLYRSRDVGSVNALEYLRELVTSVARVHGPPRGIHCRVEATDVALGLDAAVACGLIVAELVSNAFKHAFAGRESGQIQVKLSSSGEESLLEVHDDGVGLRDDFVLGGLRTLGLHLVQKLVGQLQGNLEIGRKAGAHYRISFPRNGG